jgi:hypothetical protein
MKGRLACHGDGSSNESPLSAAAVEKAMHQAIEADNAELALSYYKTASYWSKTDLATFVAAVGASKTGDWIAAYHNAIDANNRAHDPNFMRVIGDFINNIVAPNIKEPAPSPINQMSTDFVACSKIEVRDRLRPD